MAEALVPQSFAVQSGDTMRLPITVKDNSDVIVNLTGGTARFAMARSPRGTPIIDSAGSPPNATAVITTPLSGLITVEVSDENTEALNGDYYYECKVTDAFGNEAVVVRGWITMINNLT